MVPAAPVGRDGTDVAISSIRVFGICADATEAKVCCDEFHELTRSRTPLAIRRRPHSGEGRSYYRCKTCRKSLPQNFIMYSCAVCRWNICSPCAAKRLTAKAKNMEYLKVEGASFAPINAVF